MAELKERKEQLKDIARKLRLAQTDNIELVISHLAIATHYVNELPHIQSTPGTLYVISLTQKVMETYHKMLSANDKKVPDRTMVSNYNKHIEKAALQLETYAGSL
jgi:hypothetical protein